MVSAEKFGVTGVACVGTEMQCEAALVQGACWSRSDPVEGGSAAVSELSPAKARNGD